MTTTDDVLPDLADDELSSARARLVELRAALTARVVEVDRRLALLEQMLSPPAVDVVAGPAVPAPGPDRLARKVGSWPCPEPGCGFVAKAAQGLGAHRRSRHGVAGKSPGPSSSAEPAPPKSPAPPKRDDPGAPEDPDPWTDRRHPDREDHGDDERVCRCSDCDAAFRMLEKLHRHVGIAHRRALEKAERTPRTADEAAG